MKFLDQPPRFLFFTGKGGVGKTSIACATAIQLAEAGKRVLLVSTDPASNVGQVFGITIGNHITPIPAVPRLAALEIDPQAAAQAYRDRIVGPVRGVLPEAVVQGIEEQLSGACTTEIAAFDEFTCTADRFGPDSPITTTSFSIPHRPAILSAVAIARCLERFSGRRQRRRFLPRPLGWSGKTTGTIQGRRRCLGRWQAYAPDSGRPRPTSDLA